MVKNRPDLRFQPPSEKETQAAVIRLFRMAGAVVRSLSQYRPSQVAVGIPDLLCHHRQAGLAWYFETKPPLERWRDAAGNWVRYHPLHSETWRPRELDPDQVIFRDDALACGERHFWGDLRSAEEALIALGRAWRTPGGILQLGVRRLA